MYHIPRAYATTVYSVRMPNRNQGCKPHDRSVMYEHIAVVLMHRQWSLVYIDTAPLHEYVSCYICRVLMIFPYDEYGGKN